MCGFLFLGSLTMKIYGYVFILLVIGLAYFAGGQTEKQKCDSRIAEINNVKQSEIIKVMGEVNEKTFNTGVRDIRNFLHEHYTIAD